MLFARGHNFSIENNFQGMNVHIACGLGFDFNGAASRAERDLVSGNVPIGVKK